MKSEVGALADAFLAARIDHDPLDAAAYGLPGADDRLPDLSATAERAHAARYAGIADAAEALQGQAANNSAPEEADRQTLDFVAISARNFQAVAEVPSTEFTVTDFHVAPMSVLLVVLPQLPLDTAERRSGYLTRLAALPTYLEQASRRHREGVKSGRRAFARGVDGAIKQIDEVIGDADLSGIRRNLDGNDGEFAAAQSEIIESVVLPALVRYREVLASEILPTGRPDERPGICWLPEGSVMYEHLIAFNTSTRRTPEELHNLGIEVIAQLDEEYAETGMRLWGMSDPEQIRARLRSDPDLRFTTEDEVVGTAIGAVRRAEAEAPKWFGKVPDEQCAVEAVPPALAKGSPAAYYMPGAVDGSRRGTFFVNSFEPQERPLYGAEPVAFHEAVPGHHFQLTVELEAKDLHLARRVASDVACAEGWGLYAERLADEMGLYSGDLDRLGMLANDSWRAARLVVDTGMHSLGWSRGGAIDWMLGHVPMSQLECETEIDRYIGYPAQALAYMVGRLEILALRREAANGLGGAFDLRSFHDLVLAVGSVPLPALGAAVRRWVDRRVTGVT
ncbi:MAG: DUF885 domain-containing protein [Acidimicrobiales bacterium]